MPPDDLNTRYAAFDRACELEPDRECAAWMPEVSGLASDRDIHPNRLVTLAVWLIGAAFLAFLIF